MPRPTTFLARDPYRRRRLIDALRAAPIFGLLLFMVPLLGGTRSTSAAGLYLFVAWFLLILVTALLVRALSRAPGGVGADPLEPGSGSSGDEP